jgi:Protein of unknown function DUF262
MSDTTPADLVDLIESHLRQVNTTNLDISFNEILDMHSTGEINISPEFQRLFRWSEGSQSRFIESLLLEMPIPPIYVIEEDEGRYLLIDGLQRISSYLHLRGVLDAPHLDPPVKKGEKLVFSDCDIVTALNGKTYDDLGTSLQIRLKRSFVRVEVVRRGSDPRFKYHMFKRLNTGGVLLSEQQVRNCTIRLLDAKFTEYINRLSEKESFKECTATLTSERRLSAFDQELVLRFFALKNWRNHFRHDIGDFLTEYMEAVSDPENPLTFDYEHEEQIFERTFNILHHSLGPLAFSFANRGQNTLTRGFSTNHFEAITMGLQPRLGELNSEDPVQMERLKTILTEAKLTHDFYELTTGGGKNSSGQLRARIEFIEKAVAQL